MKRVCLIGVESTGKSSLAATLAARFGGVVMPEYGRQWAESHGLDFTPQALHEIALGHLAARNMIEAASPALIVEDTDIVMTSAWARMLHGVRDPALSAIAATADLYLMFARDTPWIDDGTRQFGGRERVRFDAIVRDELALRGLAAVPIGGSWAARDAAAEGAIARLLAG
jgi:NadR type nicotinamide-nucleotide adenylyltransferase